MEEEVYKTREDFETESEWYTYCIENGLDPFSGEPEKNEDEENEKYDEYGIFVCLNCGYIIDENETKPDITKPYSERLTCPNCKKRKFRKISSKRKKEILDERKQKEKNEKIKQDRLYNVTMEKIKKSITKIEYDLTEMLEDKKISQKRFMALMYQLCYFEYKYYNKNKYLDLDYNLFKDYAKSVCKTVLEKDDIDQELDLSLEELNEDLTDKKVSLDLLYFNQAKKEIAQDSLVGNDDVLVCDEITKEISDLEFEIERQEKYNEKLKNKFEIKEKNELEVNRKDKFLRELKENSRVNDNKK